MVAGFPLHTERGDVTGERGSDTSARAGQRWEEYVKCTAALGRLGQAGGARLGPAGLGRLSQARPLVQHRFGDSVQAARAER